MAARQRLARPAALASTIKQQHIESPILTLPALIIEDDIEPRGSRPHRRGLANPVTTERDCGVATISTAASTKADRGDIRVATPCLPGIYD
jgi:hypothetical protein